MPLGAAGILRPKEPVMKRCMFVDSSSVIRKVAKRILGSSELLVIEADRGQGAIDMCSADMPSIIVVDSSLPTSRRRKSSPASARWKTARCRRSPSA